ncbi:hypothetical protein ACOSP7_022689 [Xanthoceras sorbifolium]
MISAFQVTMPLHLEKQTMTSLKPFLYSPMALCRGLLPLLCHPKVKYAQYAWMNMCKKILDSTIVQSVEITGTFQGYGAAVGNHTFPLVSITFANNGERPSNL